jgi:hypothetical protein
VRLGRAPARTADEISRAAPAPYPSTHLSVPPWLLSNSTTRSSSAGASATLTLMARRSVAGKHVNAASILSETNFPTCMGHSITDAFNALHAVLIRVTSVVHNIGRRCFSHTLSGSAVTRLRRRPSPSS